MQTGAWVWKAVSIPKLANQKTARSIQHPYRFLFLLTFLTFFLLTS
jgi:hypothetical protein